MKLIIDNSTSDLIGLTPIQFKQLRNILSYTLNPQATYFSGNPNIGKAYLIDKKGHFPTGLLYLVQDWLETSKLPHYVEDKRIQPRASQRPYSLNLEHTPYDIQIQAAVACKVRQRGIVVAPTGSGKSVMAAVIISALSVRTLVVVPSLELKRQLTESLTKAFGAKLVGGLGKDIAVENIQSLSTTDNYSYDCVIIDEFHHSGAKSYRKLNKKAWNDIYYRFGLTATPMRSQENERLLLESVLSKVIYRVSYEKAIDSGYILPLQAYYRELPKVEVKGHTWAQVYKELVVENDTRNDMISMLLLQLASHSTLCLVKEIAHGQRLAELSGAPFANGEDENSKALIADFSSGRIKTLIATTGICGEGVDTRACEYVIIAGLGKSRPAFMQQCGRAFRRFGDKESAKVIIFKDISHRWTAAHFREQAKTLREEYGISLTKI